MSPLFFLVETSPKTKRKCGSKNVVENGCKDVLFGPNSMLACYCDEHDYCNKASSSININNFLFFLAPALIFQLKRFIIRVP